MSPSPRQDDQAGFSLVELLIVLALGSVLVGVLTAALGLGLRTFSGVRDQLENSARAHTAISRFATDAKSVERSRSAPSCEGAGTHLLGLTWNLGADAGEDDAAVHVDWWRQDDTVLRSTCGAVTSPPVVMLRRVQTVELLCTPDDCSAFWSLAGPGGRTDSMDVARRATPR